MKNSAKSDSSRQLSSSKENTKASPLSALKEELEALDDSEEKLKKVIAVMKSCMAQSGNPDFITFWKARKIILELFQENIQSPFRAAMWEDYCALVKEAGRLKEMFEKQSAYTIEQIDIALLALEEDIAKYPRKFEHDPHSDFSSSCKALKGSLPFYEEIQFQLGHLNAQASRIHALRKELINTEMRIRKKNQFFQRLSAAGDQVFPRRKELMTKISQQFIHDVDLFFTGNFSENIGKATPYVLREEIKELQSTAKRLTLNPPAFTQTRETLSKCWNMLKEWEREHKKEQTKKKAVAAMRSQDEKTRDELKREKERKRQKQMEDVKNRIHSFTEGQDKSNSHSLAENFSMIKQQIHQIALSDSEREDFRQLLIPLEDAVDSQEEEQLLHRQADDKNEVLSQLKEVLQRRQKKREEIKNKIEEYRKASGSSGLNFNTSLYFRDQLNVEKDRLHKINAHIRQLEEMIADFIP
ncbi:MAG: hypothetical protein WB791_01930 [Waddliaceae bacterium]